MNPNLLPTPSLYFGNNALFYSGSGAALSFGKMPRFFGNSGPYSSGNVAHVSLRNSAPSFANRWIYILINNIL
jgi:hypothetical protein